MKDDRSGAPDHVEGDSVAGAVADPHDGRGELEDDTKGTTAGANSTFHKDQPLAKSNSVLSHKSIPFTGAYPIGHLKVVQAAEPISEGREAGWDGPAEDNRAGGDSSDARVPPRLQQQQKGDVFALLSIPLDSQVGCDAMAMTVTKPAAESASESAAGMGGAAFLGFRDLPPGAHLVWLSPSGTMLRQGYWFVTRPEPLGVVRVKQWDRFNEVLGECASQYEARALANDITAVYPRLLSYDASGSQNTLLPLGQPPSAEPPSRRQIHMGPPLRDSDTTVPDAGIWAGLTSCITESVLSRITSNKPAAAKSTTRTTAATAATAHMEWMVSTTDTAKGEMAMPKTNQLWGYSEFSFLFAKDDLDPYQLIASRDSKLSSDNGHAALHAPPSRPRLAAPSDTTERVIALLEHSPNDGNSLADSDLIGELQFAFLTGTLLSNLSCLEQWWHLVLKVFLRARGLVSRRPGLCRSFIQTLHCQFLYLERHVAGGFLGHTSTGAAASTTTATTTTSTTTASSAGEEGDAGGTGIFEAKPQGAARLQASLTAFKRHLNETLLGLGKAASQDEAAAGAAFANLEASLWKYGWDLRSDYVLGEADNDDTEEGGGRLGNAADNDDDDGDIDYYEEATQQVTQPGRRTREAHRAHTGLSDTDSDSDQPVLVDLDEDGREVGLVSWN